MTRLTQIAGFLPFVAVVFLNSFVDLGHKIIVQNALFKAYDGPEQIWLTAFVNALILLPFILVFTPSGFIADRWPKPRVMRIGAFVAVAITLAITACYYLGWFWTAFAMTFVLAVQSALYSPSKFGYIKELSGNEALTTANGWVQAATSTAILAGTLVFSVLFEALLRTDSGAIGGTGLPPDELLRRIAPIGWCLVLASLIEALLTFRLPEHHPGQTALRFDRADYLSGRYLKHNLHAAWDNQVIWLAIVGLGVFWGIAQVLLAAFPAFVEDRFGEHNTVMIQGVMAFSGIGIILGAAIAGRISRDHVETGLIPVGAVGIALVLILLPQISIEWLHALNFLALGVLAGFFIVPLNALIQFNAGERELGRVLAAKNFVLNWVMLAALAITLASALADAGSRVIMVALSLVAIGGALYTIVQLPQSLLRFLLARLMHSRYRLEVSGLDHMPAQGGVLLLGNHISWIDWALVQLASPRPVRFVMERGIYERWYLRWFLDSFGVVPISEGRPRGALKKVARLLDAGQVVCLFPEGTMSKNAQLGAFKRGFERAAAAVDPGAEACILPFYLRGLWGSRFSHASAKLKRSQPAGRPRDVIVAFGPVLPITANAETVKQAVFGLSISSWEGHAATLPTLPVAWLRRAKRRLAATAVIDADGYRLSNRRLIAAVLIAAERLRHRCPDARLAILLPPGRAAVIANLAAWMAGKQVVHLDATASTDTLIAVCRQAGIAQLVSAPGFLDRLHERGLEPERLFAQRTLIDAADLHGDGVGWQHLLALGGALLLPSWLLVALSARQRPHPQETAAILVVRGDRTSPGKAVALSHRHLVANIEQIVDVLNIEQDDVMLANLPLSHTMGLTVTTCLPLLAGVPMVCHPESTDALGTAKTIARYRATLLFSTPTLLGLLLAEPRIHPLMLEPLRLLVTSTEPLGSPLREGFALRFRKPIFEGYGVTEATPLASVNIPDVLETRHWTIQTGCKPGTVGMPLPGTCFRIVDPVTLKEQPRGGEGQVLIGGVPIMQGYLGDPERTAEVIVELDGRPWLRTDDRGWVDPDGFLTLTEQGAASARMGSAPVSTRASNTDPTDAAAKPLVQQAPPENPPENRPRDHPGDHPAEVHR
ncbi:MFS transporter [Halochromatium glycolicum]|uniref:Acyl-[ACP]--phospholipid O-acyltransferase n=1 Tax=Halochromatium glycolicum TaxID=85075 RepID=A0AAJ0X9U2_9GAMM|nr:MFS transporter [Halochromatium glycolicum]MBK1704598.1 acyl-[ACP]--phospholipid O-acyltransferase [Halochromatium glycolicum]